MNTARLDEMVRGWFVGDFQPAAFSTQSAEVGYKTYEADDYEPRHHHKVATEITLLVSGIVEMNGKRYSAGDIIVLAPGDATDFRALTAAATVVVKVPAARNDKYSGDP